MTVANQIVGYLEQHGRATRPELEKAFGLLEKSVDSAIRKLERLGYIKRAGKTPKVHHQKSAVVFVMADAEVNARLSGSAVGALASQRQHTSALRSMR